MKLTDDPKEGYYKVRMGSGKPWVPARYWFLDGERLSCEECDGTGKIVIRGTAPRLGRLEMLCHVCLGDPRGVLVSDQIPCAMIADESVVCDNGIPRYWPWHPILDAEPVDSARSKAEYDFKLKEYRWAVAHAPDEPIANPFERVDIRKARIKP